LPGGRVVSKHRIAKIQPDVGVVDSLGLRDSKLATALELERDVGRHVVHSHVGATLPQLERAHCFVGNDLQDDWRTMTVTYDESAAPWVEAQPKVTPNIQLPIPDKTHLRTCDRRDRRNGWQLGVGNWELEVGDWDLGVVISRPPVS
jgi:hypothetical protein